MTYDFTITDSPPEKRQFGGSGNVGRKRGNPFDEQVLNSYKGKFADSGEWVEFFAEPDDVKKEVARIRNAGTYLRKQGYGNVGTEIRSDPATGRITFRGVEHVGRSARKREAPATEGKPAAEEFNPYGVYGERATDSVYRTE